MRVCSSRLSQGVQPEAVSFLQRAIKAQAHRMLASAALGGTGDGPGAKAPVARTLAAEDIYTAIRQPAPSMWMAPPCQRVGSSLAAFAKFAS